MDSGSSSLVMQLFDEAAELDPPSRIAFLDRRCDDGTIRREVESLLTAYDDSGGFLNERSSDGIVRARELEPHQTGSRIGNYELLDLLGEGGFARVFQARQIKPVRRDVAIKIIKLGMDTRAVIARFELERQALAMMDHPGIAAVYDAGATDAGRPFFVMELVRGERITRFADDVNLDVHSRVRLFVEVCNAVHHAHQKGILHRDLKPSNILVTVVDGQPLPKIIDFGIAKATRQGVTDATFMTSEQQMLGTPRYMSPEQAISGGADVDTRSDIYSLGTVLHELLTGIAPMQGVTDTPSSVITDLSRLRTEHVTPLPSTRVTDASRRHELRGDLDWIVLKCLSFDRAQRYESAAALAADLQSHLDHRPILAAPPTAIYRAGKFVRRNALAVSAVAMVAVALLAGTIVSTMQAIRAKRAEHLAETRLKDAVAANESLSAVNRFLTKDLIGAADPQVARGRELTVREALDNAARALNGPFADRPLVEAALRQSVGMAYQGLGKFDEGIAHTAKALDTRKRVLGSDHPDTILALNDYVFGLFNLGRFSEAEPLARDAVSTAQRALGRDDHETIRALASLGQLLTAQGRWKDAEAPSLEAWQRSHRVFGDDDATTVSSLLAYTTVLSKTGRSAEAEPLLKAAMDGWRTQAGNTSPIAITLLNNYALLLANLGRDAAAMPLYKEAWQLSQRVRGEDHTETVACQNNYAMMLQRLGRADEAEPLFKDALERRQRTLGEDHPQTLTSLNNYGTVMMAQNRWADAEPYIKLSLEKHQRVLGPTHPAVFSALGNYARIHKEMNRLPQAEELLREAFTRSRALGADHPLSMQMANNLGGHLLDAKRPAEAEPIFRDTLAGRRRTLGDSHPQTLRSSADLGEAVEAQGRPSEALPIYEELYAKAPLAQISPAMAAEFMSHYGVCLARLGRFRDAEAPLLEVARRIDELKKSQTPLGRKVREALATVFDQTDRPDKAADIRAELELEAGR